MVMLAFPHMPATNPRAQSETRKRAIDWLIAMQSSDGGWAAFDVDNNRTFLNQIPFSDMDSLCDPSSPDVSGRVLEAIGLWLKLAPGPSPLRRRVARAIPPIAPEAA